MKNRLTLKRETLTELNLIDLSNVVGGGADAITVRGLTCPLRNCPIDFTATSCECCTASGSC